MKSALVNDPKKAGVRGGQCCDDGATHERHDHHPTGHTFDETFDPDLHFVENTCFRYFG